MDFRAHVRNHLTALTIGRGSEIVDELAQHLQDLYDEARVSGLDHDEALARALAALPRERDSLTRYLESASRSMCSSSRWRVSD
jgi:hypothetical protein